MKNLLILVGNLTKNVEAKRIFFRPGQGMGKDSSAYAGFEKRRSSANQW